MRKNPTQIAGLALVAALALMAFGSPASAQITGQEAFNLFGTEYGDPFSSVFLNQIFGPLFPSATESNVSTVFSSIIGYFNIIILVVGGLMFFYNVTVGVLQSSHEGSVLGQRWSSLWAPLRIIFAVGLLVPVPGAGGYNLAQTGVAYIVRGATNVASAVWGEAATLVISGATPITAVSPTVDPRMVKTLYQNAVCRKIVAEQLGSVAALGSNPMTLTVTDRMAQNGSRTIESAIRDSNDAVFADGICGSYSTPPLPSYLASLAPGADELALPEPDEIGLPGSQRAQVLALFSNTHNEVLSDLETAMNAIVDAQYLRVFNEMPPEKITTQVINAVESANSKLELAMNNIMTEVVGSNRYGQASRDALLNRITGNCAAAAPTTNEGGGNAGSDIRIGETARCYGEGWLGAGSWYMLMARMNNEIAGLTSAQSTAELGNYISDASASGEATDNLLSASGNGPRWYQNSQAVRDRSGMTNFAEISRLQKGYLAIFENSTAELATLGFQLSPEQMHTLMTSSTDLDEALVKLPGVSAKVAEYTQSALEMTSPGNAGADPMIGLVNLGNQILNISFAIIGVVTIGSFFSVGLAVAMMPILSALLTAGGTLSYILPILPFVYWVLAVTGYFLLIVEAVIAVNLWALSHMRMDGEGISGEAGRTGWLMLLSLMMTPVLMIFGFLVGMTLFRVTSALLDIGINQAITGIVSGGLLVQLAAIAVYSIMIAMFYIVILERSFSLVSEFPGKVMRWVGANSELTAGEEGRARGVAMATGAAVYAGSQKGLQGGSIATRATGKKIGKFLGSDKGGNNDQG